MDSIPADRPADRPSDRALDRPRDRPLDRALDRALARVGDRWTLLVVEALLDGPRRYGELASAVAGIAPNILASRLRKLEVDGLAIAVPYSTRPLRVQYELTSDGRDLARALSVLAGWAARVESISDGAREHDACGTPLEIRFWCPTCGLIVDDDHVDDDDHLGVDHL